MQDYDVLVLGGGSAGTSAARAAAAAGARTLLVNDGPLGGLCILRGCMPTKAMLSSAHALHEASADHLEPLGVRLEGRAVVDFRAVMERKDRLVERFRSAKVASVEAQPYEVRFGRARFIAGGGVEIDGEPVGARRFVVATGSVPAGIDVPGIGHVRVLSSDDVMRLETPPPAMVVQGGGPIGLELAQFFARIGTRVLLVNRSAFCKKYDGDVGDELLRALAAEPGLDVAVPGKIEAIRSSGELPVFEVGTSGGTVEFPAADLLMATGRDPALDDLGLEYAGVDVLDGRVVHDDRMRTSNPAVFVAGDATGGDQILHVANQEGAAAGHNAAGGSPEWIVDRRLAMHVIFTDPPVCHVGLTEAEAADRGIPIVTGMARFPETGRAITMGARFGLWKLLAHAETGEVLGSALIGPRADDLAHLVSVMMAYRGNVRDIPTMPWYHPTLSEVMLNLHRDAVAKLPARS